MDKAAEKAVKALSSCLCCLMKMPSKNLKASYVNQDKTERYIDMLKECFGICIDIDSNTVGICEECVGRLRDASNFKVQVQRCQVQLQRLMRKVIQVLQEVEEPEVKSEIAVDDGTSDNLLGSAPLLPEMADGGAPRQESALRECTLTHAELEMEPEVKSEMPSEEDETGDEMCRNQSPLGSSPIAAGAASYEDSATPGCVGMFCSGALSARARQQLAMTCVVRLERLRQSQCQPRHVDTDHEASLTTHTKDMHTDSAVLRAEEEACTCDTCGEQFTDKTDLVDHIQTHMETTYSCYICSLEFPCKILFSKHSRTHKTPKVYICEICGKVYSSKCNLNIHSAVHTGRKPYSCDVCNKCFARKDHLNNHIRTHTGQKPFKCELCGKRFKQISSLYPHVRAHAGQKSYKCEICSKQFIEKSALTSHIRIHTGQKIFKCELCHRRFMLKSTLNAHMTTHTSHVKIPYKCEICNKQYSCKSTLNSHVITHTGQKLHKCEICHKQFTHRASMYNHMIIHTGQKPYGCEICNKRFTYHASLYKHTRIHTGQRPYKCDVCNKRFIESGHLKQHIRIHTGQKPYECEICNKQFNQKTHLNTHMTIHTGQKPYKCEICTKQFTVKSALNKHMRIHPGKKS